MGAPSITTFLGKKNNAKTTITNNPLSDSGLSITLATGTGAKFPSSGQFLVTLWDNTTYPNDPTSDPNMELVLIDSRSSDTLTVNASGRGYGGTTGVSHASGSALALLVTKEHMDEYETAIAALEAVAFRSGWIPAGVTFTYSSVDNPTGVITSSADISDILSVGMRLRMVNAGNTIYGIITAISGTTITFLHEIDTATQTQALTILQNSAITAPYFSYHKAPYGFPTDTRKWTYQTSSTSDLAQASPTLNTWYNPSYSLNIPIGSWFVSYGVAAKTTRASTVTQDIAVTLSTANNSESDADFTSYALENASGNGANSITLVAFLTRTKNIVLASKTAYYLNIKAPTANSDEISFNGSKAKTITRAICAYL